MALYLPSRLHAFHEKPGRSFLRNMHHDVIAEVTSTFAEANADRIAACWNACVGIEKPDPRLFAAAPDLLAALKFALRESGCDGDLCAHEWHDRARAAIAKAEAGE